MNISAIQNQQHAQENVHALIECQKSVTFTKIDGWYR